MKKVFVYIACCFSAHTYDDVYYGCYTSQNVVPIVASITIPPIQPILDIINNNYTAYNIFIEEAINEASNTISKMIQDTT